MYSATSDALCEARRITYFQEHETILRMQFHKVKNNKLLIVVRRYALKEALKHINTNHVIYVIVYVYKNTFGFYF